MFARIFALLPLALLVSASPLEARDQCNTGPIQCCNSVQSAQQVSGLLSTVGVLVANAAALGQVGVTCSPLSVIGVGSGCAATQQPVCCTNNNFNGVVNLGCSPVNIVL
ncbi:hydrophobin [Gyrodon lividus]|nr:hydrophobin [Gyrodon lividus]